MMGIKGNEEADILAGDGVNTPFSGPEPYRGLSKSRKKQKFDGN